MSTFLLGIFRISNYFILLCFPKLVHYSAYYIFYSFELTSRISLLVIALYANFALCLVALTPFFQIFSILELFERLLGCA